MRRTDDDDRLLNVAASLTVKKFVIGSRGKERVGHYSNQQGIGKGIWQDTRSGIWSSTGVTLAALRQGSVPHPKRFPAECVTRYRKYSMIEDRYGVGGFRQVSGGNVSEGLRDPFRTHSMAGFRKPSGNMPENGAGDCRCRFRRCSQKSLREHSGSDSESYVETVSSRLGFQKGNGNDSDRGVVMSSSVACRPPAVSLRKPFSRSNFQIPLLHEYAGRIFRNFQKRAYAELVIRLSVRKFCYTAEMELARSPAKGCDGF